MQQSLEAFFVERERQSDFEYVRLCQRASRKEPKSSRPQLGTAQCEVTSRFAGNAGGTLLLEDPLGRGVTIELVFIEVLDKLHSLLFCFTYVYLVYFCFT